MSEVVKFTDKQILDELADLFARHEWRVDDSGASFIEATHSWVVRVRNTEMRTCRVCGMAIERDYDDDPDRWVDARGLTEWDDDEDERTSAHRHEPKADHAARTTKGWDPQDTHDEDDGALIRVKDGVGYHPDDPGYPTAEEVDR